MKNDKSPTAFLNHVAQTSDAPLALEFVKAEGVYLINEKGEKTIDLIAGIGVSNIGHSHPAVVTAVQNQAAKFMHLMVYGEFVQCPQTDLAQKLTSLLPKSLDSVYFTNSGAEATEGAMKLAKRYTQRSKFIHFKNHITAAHRARLAFWAMNILNKISDHCCLTLLRWNTIISSN